MIPPKTALYIYETGAAERDRAIEKSRRDRAARAFPRRPHAGQRMCGMECEPCVQWARDLVASRAAAGDGS